MTAEPSTSTLDADHPTSDAGSQRDSRGGRPVAKDARAVANYFLEKAKEQGKSLTPMQLVKLVYIAHGWRLAWYDHPLIGDDVEAWRYGPVIASVYHAFKKYGRDPIVRPTYGEYDLVIDIGLVDPNDKVIKPKPIAQRFSSDEKRVMDEILRTYGKLTGLQLSKLTHEPGSPWEQAYRPGGGNRVIGNDIIKTHFLELARENSRYLEHAS